MIINDIITQFYLLTLNAMQCLIFVSTKQLLITILQVLLYVCNNWYWIEILGVWDFK